MRFIALEELDIATSQSTSLSNLLLIRVQAHVIGECVRHEALMRCLRPTCVGALCGDLCLLCRSGNIIRIIHLKLIRRIRRSRLTKPVPVDCAFTDGCSSNIIGIPHSDRRRTTSIPSRNTSLLDIANGLSPSCRTTFILKVRCYSTSLSRR